MRKSILYILVVLMALSLTLGAVSAEDAAEDAIAADSLAADAPALGEAAGGEVTAADIPFADVETDVEPLMEDEYDIVWGIGVANNGPDVASDIDVYVDGSDNLYLWDVYPLDGTFDMDTLIWHIDYLIPGDAAVLILDTIKIGEGPYWVDAFAVTWGSIDPDYSNNYDIGWADLPAEDVSAGEDTLPAAGNPIAMVLLALISIAGATFARRF